MIELNTKFRWFEEKLAKLRIDLNAKNNIDLIVKAR
jgi:hypothetical protein